MKIFLIITTLLTPLLILAKNAETLVSFKGQYELVSVKGNDEGSCGDKIEILLKDTQLHLKNIQGFGTDLRFLFKNEGCHDRTNSLELNFSVCTEFAETQVFEEKKFKVLIGHDTSLKKLELKDNLLLRTEDVSGFLSGYFDKNLDVQCSYQKLEY